MTEDQVRAMVMEAIKPFAKGITHTGFTHWCRASGVKLSHASEFMNGKRSPTTDLLDALGLEYRIMPKDEGCPFCNDRSSFKGDPADSFCERHLSMYRATGGA
jgi:hypothetical protein